ncbi:MAG: glycosyltransferase family 4 protein [Planctomycetota bacterium]
MDPTSRDSPHHQVLCLVADDEAADLCPSAIRYLQVGLIDEPIETVLVVPETARALSLESGRTVMVTYRQVQWPLAHWARRNLIAEVHRRIRSLQADASIVVHAWSASSSLMAARLAEALGGELVLTVSDTAAMDSPEGSDVYSKAAALVASSDHIRQAIETTTVGTKILETISPGVVATSGPAAFSNPQRAPSLIFAGSLSADSGLEVLLHAVKLVLPHHPNLSTFVIGKGNAEGHFRQLVEAFDLGMDVTFTGRLDEWRAAIQAADIFCVPGGSRVFREEPIQALATGLATIVPQDTVCDGLIDQQTALLFSPGDPASLAQRIRRLLEDRAFARTIAASGQAYARTHHSISRMVAEYVELYRRLDPRAKSLPMPAPDNQPES